MGSCICVPMASRVRRHKASEPQGSSERVLPWQVGHHGPINMCVCVYVLKVCVCVFFPFILDVRFVGRISRGHTGGRSHRISHPRSFCGACLNFSREKVSAVPFPRRPLRLPFPHPLTGRPGSSEVPRNLLTRWDVSSIPANGIFLTKKQK